MLRSFQNMERDHRGYNIASALLGVVDTLAALPGRKTIVFFSEGFPVSPALSAQLDAVIDAANRANVTTYAIDANGLRTRAATTALKREMEGFVEDRLPPARHRLGPDAAAADDGVRAGRGHAAAR